MLNVLIVDDEKNIRKIITEYLNAQNINTIEASNGLEALELFKQKMNDIDLIIMDVMMPKMDGIESSIAIKKMANTPIIMLTAKTEDEDEIKGLKCGANDYIGKPFNLEILLIKIKKLTNTEETNPALILDENTKSVISKGKKIELTNKEFELLNYLYINSGQVLSREIILDRIWGMDYYGDYRTVDTHVKKLRAKMDKHKKYIKTYRGVGYKFVK